MYTEREKSFPSPFTFDHTKVAPPSHLFGYLSSLFPSCILAVTSRPSYLAWKGEEHQTQKTQTYTSSLPALFACARWMLHDQTKQSYNNCVDTIFFLGKMNGLTSLLSLTSATSPAVKKLLGWKQVTRFFMNSHLSRLSAARGYSTRFFQVGPIKV